jgi:predicted nucleic acid-binding protein
MKFLLDTCLLSELVKPRPDPAVIAWVDQQDESRLFLSVLTLGELRKGVERLKDGGKRIRLGQWIDEALLPRFATRLLAIDSDVAEQWGRITAQANAKGFVLPVIDGLIAATGLVHGLTVVTRNVSDIQISGVSVFNPWEKIP